MRRGIMEGMGACSNISADREHRRQCIHNKKTANTSQSYCVMKHTPMLTGGGFWAVNRSPKPIKSEIQSSQER